MGSNEDGNDKHNSTSKKNGCEVHVFGSQATGLLLPSSDIDFVVMLPGYDPDNTANTTTTTADDDQSNKNNDSTNDANDNTGSTNKKKKKKNKKKKNKNNNEK